MTCCEDRHHRHDRESMGAGELAALLVRCGPVAYPHPNPSNPDRFPDGPSTGESTAGDVTCVVTGKTPKGCGPVGCFPGVTKQHCCGAILGGCITSTTYEP